MKDLLKETKDFAAQIEDIEDAKNEAIQAAFRNRFHVEINKPILDEIMMLQGHDGQELYCWNSVVFAAVDTPEYDESGHFSIPYAIVYDVVATAGRGKGFKFHKIL